MSRKKVWIKRARRKLKLLSCLQRNQQLDFKSPIQPELITKCFKRSSTLIFLISNSSRKQFTTLSRLYHNLRSRVQHHQSARNNSSNPLRRWQRWAKSTLAKVLKTKTTFTASSWKSMIDLPDSASACHCINKLTWWSSFWITKWAKSRPVCYRNRRIIELWCKRHSYRFLTIWLRLWCVLVAARLRVFKDISLASRATWPNRKRGLRSSK